MMSDNIFTNYPTWTGTKATDTSNILDSLANAYNKQQQSFEGLATLHDDFWKTAQKQHQQDAVHFLNNMSADNLVKQDAKQNFLNALKQQGEDIGGYSNMSEWDTLYDSRVNTAIANENAIKNHKVAQVTDDIRAATIIANNVTGTNSPDEVDKAIDYLNNLDRHYGDDPTKLQAAIHALTPAKQDALNTKANLDALYEASTKNDYEKLVAPTMNSYINKWGIASAMVRIGKATGDESLVKQGQDAISSLSSMFNKKGTVGADGQQITEDGGLTSFIAQQPKNVQDYFFKHFDNWKNEATDRHHKQFSSDSDLSLNYAKHRLNEKIANEEINLSKTKLVVNTAIKTAQLNQDNEQFIAKLKQDEQKAHEENTDPYKVNKGAADSLAKNFGLYDPVVKDKDGNWTLNRLSINKTFSKIYNTTTITNMKLLEQERGRATKELSKDGRLINVKFQLGKEEHNNYMVELLGRKPTEDEKNYVELRILQTPEASANNENIKVALAEYEGLRRKHLTETFENLLTSISQLTGQPVANIMYSLEWGRGGKKDSSSNFFNYLTVSTNKDYTNYVRTLRSQAKSNVEIIFNPFYPPNPSEKGEGMLKSNGLTYVGFNSNFRNLGGEIPPSVGKLLSK
ncbi:hypothetical protein [Moraxella sp. ZY200743]|uniref:hypothetical protein n=1 Tax=Moraxella sp. ZY200743 TaxID=2911970 RepID=UPI003D7ED74F